MTTTQPPVIVIGAGGHGLVVAEALLCAGRELIGFVDADAARSGQSQLCRPVLGDDAALARYRSRGVLLVNGVGGRGSAAEQVHGTLRWRVQQRLQAEGWRFVGVRHPSAVVSAHALVDDAAQVLAGAIVQPGARVGCGAIVNTRALVEHDGVIGEFAHIAPGAVLCGDVRIGAQAHIGAGAVVRQGLSIGDRVIVGVGAAVVHDVAAGTVVGVPARALERRA
jgi:sugar O-acyltransferase (sialic acid O-acetyltransferase NeuD family)